MKKIILFFVLVFLFFCSSCQYNFDSEDYEGKATATSSTVLLPSGTGVNPSLFEGYKYSFSVEVIDKEREKHEFTCFSTETVESGDVVYIKWKKLTGK